MASGKTFHLVGGTVIDFYFAGIFQYYAAGENYIPTVAVAFVFSFRHQQRSFADADNFILFA